jgi:hypothetical protein
LIVPTASVEFNALRLGHTHETYLRRRSGPRPPFLPLRAPATHHAGARPAVTVHRFEETIGGRAYPIEVTPVGNRWRAHLCRRPGVPTAMMPFYGATPDEAAGQLLRWLAMAHRARALAQDRSDA